MSSAATALAPPKAKYPKVARYKLKPSKWQLRVPMGYINHFPRLLDGVEKDIVQFMLNETFGAELEDRAADGPNLTTRPLSTHEITAYVNAESTSDRFKSMGTEDQERDHAYAKRNVEYALKNLLEREVLARADGPPETYRYTLPSMRKWENLPDRPKAAEKKSAASSSSVDSKDEKTPSRNPFRYDPERPPKRPYRPSEPIQEIEVVSAVPVELRPKGSGALQIFVETPAPNEIHFAQNEKPPSNQQPKGGWNEFFLAAADAKLDFTEVDLAECEGIFRRLPIAQQLAATKRLRDCIALGKWEDEDAEFKPYLINYLRRRMWQLDLRPKVQKLTKREQMYKEIELDDARERLDAQRKERTE